jgi:predicted Zn-dependent protease with MMP-like domain
VERIFLFKRNLEKVAQSRPELVEQIQVTVKHEVGHYLGLDEDEIDRLGLA